MKKNYNSESLISSNVIEILGLYIKDEIILNPIIFDLERYSHKELQAKNFEIIGDDYFVTYEKYYRCMNSLWEVKLKSIFISGSYSSNSLEIYGLRCTTFFKKIKNNNYPSIKKIEVYISNLCQLHFLINESIIIDVNKDTNLKGSFKLRQVFSLFEYPSIDGYSQHRPTIRLKTFKDSYEKISAVKFSKGKSKKYEAISKLLKKLIGIYPHAFND